MGYESKIYIVRKAGVIKDKNGCIYSQVIAMFNMCKFPALSKALKDKPETCYYFYADDGNTEVLEDCYGKPLTEATVKYVIDLLEKEIEKGEDYWRIYPLLAALKQIEKYDMCLNNIVVLH